MLDEEERVGVKAVVAAYCILHVPVTSSQYLGRVLFSEDDEWASVVSNIWRSRQKWAQLTRVLSREGGDERTSGQIYLTVVQSVMLYGSETRVVTSHIGKVLGGLHHRVTQSLTGRQPWQERGGVWVYPPLDSAMAEATLKDLKT